MIEYIQLLWNNVLKYTLIDTIVSALIFILFYLIASVICQIEPVQHHFKYIMLSLRTLGLIYIFSTFVLSVWNHVIFMKRRLSVNICMKPSGDGDTTARATQEDDIDKK